MDPLKSARHDVAPRILLLLTLLALGQGALRAQCDPAFVTRSDSTWTVLPSGAQDTANLQCALGEAALAGPGSRVQLVAGTYSCAMVEVTGFRGTLAGAGLDLTVIRALGGLPCSAVPFPDTPALFKFRTGDLRVEDLSFSAPDPAPCLPAGPLGAILSVTGPSVLETGCQDLATPSPSSVTVERVAFSGAADAPPLQGHNVAAGLLISPECYGIRAHLLTGEFRVHASTFEHLNTAVLMDQVGDSTILLGGSPSLGNTVTDVLVGVYLADLSACDAELSHNTIRAEFANIYADQYLLLHPRLTALLVSHNTLFVDGESDGVGLADYSSAAFGPSLSAEVSNNDFFLNTLRGGIFGYFGTSDVLVRGNCFWGTAGNAAIYTGLMDTCPDTRWAIAGNDLNEVAAGVAPVWLGPASRQCSVTGERKSLGVLDEGLGNTIKGEERVPGRQPAGDPRRTLRGRLDKPPLR